MNADLDGSIPGDALRILGCQDVQSMPCAVFYGVKLTNDLRISIFIQAVQLGSVSVCKPDKARQERVVASESVRSRHLVAVVEFRHLVFKNVHYFRWQDLPRSGARSSDVREQFFRYPRKSRRGEHNRGVTFNVVD